MKNKACFRRRLVLYKYPRTPHLPWSAGKSNDDKVLKDVSHFLGKNIVITEKMDGENTTLYKDYFHARSLDSSSHPSQSWVRNLQGSISHLIEDSERICGENLFAKHSIPYVDLPSYFLVFGVARGDSFLSWEDTEKRCQELGLNVVPVLYRGIFDKNLSFPLRENQEGYVVRLADSFNVCDFGKSVAKFVRANHVQTDQHWKNQKMVLNGLVGGKNGIS